MSQRVRLLCCLVFVSLLCVSVVWCYDSDSSGSSSEDNFQVLEQLSESPSRPSSGTSSGDDSEEGASHSFMSVDGGDNELPDTSRSSSPVTRRRRKRGRKPKEGLTEEFLRDCVAKGLMVEGIVRACASAVSANTVRRRLREYGISLKPLQLQLPASREEYEALLKEQTVSMIASSLGHSKSVVERHMKKLGVIKYPVLSDTELTMHIRTLRRNDLQDAGVTFMRSLRCTSEP
mmetsp:Transcript_22681/g.38033  ORF Transcript_22681/g.38033 Transcript_22681/m.38033 type:complete len:233 (+) Transcript_22681:174-872(+)